MTAREFSKTRIVTSRRARGTLVAALACIAGALLPLQSPLAHGQTYTVLDSFNGANGSSPNGNLVLSGSTLYGLASMGGAGLNGAIFSDSIVGGSLTDLYSFGVAGGWPTGSLTLSYSATPTLYGTSTIAGAYGSGQVFAEPVTGGNLTTLASFNGNNSNDGMYPHGSLLLNGPTLYGMTYLGGANGDGTIFSVPAAGGAPTTLFSFNGTNGAYPYGNSFILSSGILYGMTQGGGANNNGTIFAEPQTGGNPTTLLSFNGTNGSFPNGSLILNSVGSTLYGMTSSGGTNGYGVIFSEPITGSAPTILFNFNQASGINPYGSLILDGTTLYGMTYKGGANNYGTIFSEPLSGGPTVLVSFTGVGGADPGGLPYGDLLLSGSTFYGMTNLGGTGTTDDGVIFALDMSPNGNGTTTPEPASWLSFLVFAAVLGLIGWRRRVGRMKAEG